MKTHRIIIRQSLIASLICLFVLTNLAVYAGDDKPKYDLPPEIQSLPESARPEPARTVLDFDSTAAAIADTARAVVWLRFKPNPQGEIGDIGVVFSSHPNFGLEERAIEALKAASFDPVQMFRKRLAKRLYYEVVFDRALLRSLVNEREMIELERRAKAQAVADSVRNAPLEALEVTDSALRASLEKGGVYDSATGEFVPAEVYPEMIYQTRPDYPRLAKAQGQTGTVWVIVLVNTEGIVEKALIAKTSGHPLLDKSALDAAYKNKFKPGIINGKPVACWGTYRVDFSLEYK